MTTPNTKRIGTKYLIIMIVLVVLMVCGLFWIVDKFTTSIETIEAEYEEHVGEMIVIDSDTLIITGYDMLRENYTLSNGVEVTKSYVESKSED